MECVWDFPKFMNYKHQYLLQVFIILLRLKFKSYKHLAEEEVEFDPRQER